MRIIFDTNVLISAFIATGTSKDVFEYAVENHEVIASPYILKELKRNLIQKLGFSQKEYKEIEELLADTLLILSEKKSKIQNFSDKKDVPILNLCDSAQASLLVTGDKQLLRLKEIGSTKIINPSDFWDIEKGKM